MTDGQTQNVREIEKRVREIEKREGDRDEGEGERGRYRWIERQKERVAGSEHKEKR